MSIPFKIFFSAVGIFLLSYSPLQAQRFSAVLNISNFNIDNVSSGNTNIDYEGSTSLLLNARFFTQKNWAFRFGVGLDNLTYTVGDSLMTDYNARRRDLTGVFGIEKHFKIAFLDFYPGLFVPVTVVGEDILEENFDNIQNGTFRAGLGFVAGINARLLKILLVGVEFDATFDDFKTGFWQGVNDLSFAPISAVNYSTSFTIGVTF
ncbi:MAG: hypothetical protein AAF696_38405 [Bacteroidota bacterium]